MATMNSIIEYVDGVKPNAYDDEVKYRWINTLEGKIHRHLFCQHVPKQKALREQCFLFWRYYSRIRSRSARSRAESGSVSPQAKLRA